ncbi:hypothetical protein [Microbacterium sp. Bi121]|uniref:hypothetical protein n=1 Tax=Microbacterium sp. Bi121 TaxID=2822348 RepID=UPI001E14CC40|nr:hypothetical protein [Microbacterium sp. Bi121]CAH0123301.1 hypothetical protein SRABI121_00480 [Microbacterium sp. Bi121]
MSVPNPPAAPAPQQLPPPMPPAGAPVSGPKKNNVLAMVAMIVAIVGFIFACIPGALIVGWILLPIAFVLSIVSLFLKGDRKWMGIVGLIVSVVGTIVGFIVFFAVVATSFNDAFGSGDTAVEQPAQLTDEADAVADDETQADPAEDERQDLALVETAFGRSDFDSSTWWYVAVIDNPNEDYIFSFSGIDVEALDASGTILDSSSDYRTILSGRTAVTGTFFDVGQGEIASLEVRGPEASAATRAPQSSTGAFDVTDVAATSDEWSTNVNGKVTSSFADDQESVMVVVVARDASGKIIGAESGYIDRLPTGGTAQFEVTFFDPLPGGTQYEAYAVL